MGIASFIFSKLTKFFGSTTDINDENYVPVGGNIDNTPYVHTAYSDAHGAKSKRKTIIAKGDIKDYHLKRSCRWDNMTIIKAEIHQFPETEERLYEHVRSVPNPNLLIKLFASIPDKSRLETEIEALETDQLTLDEINRVGADGFAPITVIASNPGNANAIRLFARKGFSLTTADAEGRTALIQAAKNGINENVRAILEVAGNDYPIGHADSQGMTALHYAAQNGKSESVDLLIKAGAPINPISAVNAMPIHMAAMAALSADLTPQSPNLVNWELADSKKSFELLRDNGGDMEKVCDYGFSARQLETTIQNKKPAPKTEPAK